MKKLTFILILSLFCNIAIAKKNQGSKQNITTYRAANVITFTTDTLHTKNQNAKKVTPEIGLQAGRHSEDLTQHSSGDFNDGIFIEGYLKFNLSDEVYFITAFTYWKSRTEKINSPVVQLNSEVINSRGLKMGLGFTLFKICSTSLSLGPSLSIEKITNVTNAVLSLGINLNLNMPLWSDKVNLLSTLGHQNGSEALNFGGGSGYSFFYYLLGIEVNIGN